MRPRSTRSGSASRRTSSRTRVRAVDLNAGDGERATDAMLNAGCQPWMTAPARAADDRGEPDRPCRSTWSTPPTSCSARTTRRGPPVLGRDGTILSAACPGCATSSCTCSARRARRTSAARRTGSSSRSGTTSSRATSRPPACRPSCSTSSRSPRRRSRRSGSSLWPMVELEADDAIAAAAGRSRRRSDRSSGS